MEITEVKERYITDINGQKVNVGDCCCFRAKGMLCIGIYKGIGEKGTIQFGSIVDDTEFHLRPSGIEHLTVFDFMKDYLNKKKGAIR